ncbi:MAG: zinc dependent phospholipase C family protein [Coprococcus sp.]
METKDHLALGKYLLNNNENSFTPLQEKLFLLGNIMPDIWLPSYVKGAVKRKNLQGHICSNAKKRVNKHSSYLKKRHKSKYKSSFILGVLLHYLADSLTYPHSDDYAYGMKTHKKYEKEMHQMIWREFIMTSHTTPKTQYPPNIKAIVKKIYDRYTELEHTPYIECQYIIKSAEKVFTAALYPSYNIN